VERIDVLEEKYRLDKEREMRMDAHRFTLMEDVDRLEDILEAVVTGVANTRHAAFLSAQAGLSRVASFEFVNVTATSTGVTVRYLTRLYQTVEVKDVFMSATYSQVRTPPEITSCTLVTVLRCLLPKWRFKGPVRSAVSVPCWSYRWQKVSGGSAWEFVLREGRQ
jgi:hypothetical protein